MLYFQIKRKSIWAMSSTQNQNDLSTIKMLFDTIVCFKPDSELKNIFNIKLRSTKYSLL